MSLSRRRSGWTLITRWRTPGWADSYLIPGIYSALPPRAVFSRAKAAAWRALEIDETLKIENFYAAHYHLGLIYVQKGMPEKAIDELQTAWALDDNPTILAVLGHAYAVSGKRDEAREIIGELKGLAAHRYVLPCNIAMIYTALGERDEAFEWLEKAYADRDVWLVVLKVEPVFDNLRSDPRFRDLLGRIGLTH